MFASEKSGLPPRELLIRGENGFVEMVVYESSEPLQASSGSLVNKSGHFLTHCPVSGPSRSSCHSVIRGQAPLETLSPKHTGSSYLLPLSLHRSLLCTNISNGPKTAFASLYSGGSQQFCGYNRRLSLGHCWLDHGDMTVISPTGQRAFPGVGN